MGHCTTQCKLNFERICLDISYEWTYGYLINTKITATLICKLLTQHRKILNFFNFLSSSSVIHRHYFSLVYHQMYIYLQLVASYISTWHVSNIIYLNAMVLNRTYHAIKNFVFTNTINILYNIYSNKTIWKHSNCVLAVQRKDWSKNTQTNLNQ